MYYRNRETQRRLKLKHTNRYLNGIYYDEESGRYKRYYLGSKYWKNQSNRHFRRKPVDDELDSNKSTPHKEYEYKWHIC